jgi:radical SAM superfamily enzyme YgiQ (UPF0313 family)
MESYKSRLTIFLIRPSRYDDAGYLVRHVKGVIPSNTLATLHGLNLSLRLEGIEVESVPIDEAVQPVPFGRIFRRARRHRVVVALCGVQTNQFVRALELARRFRARGIDVLVGGFHVSGVNALVPGTAPEITEMLATGAHVVRGEVDAVWGDIMRQLLAGTLPSWVDYLHAQPDLAAMPLPVADAHYMKRFAIGDQCTIDASRGCPFNCSFCTIINIQGRQMRARKAEAILTSIRRQYARGIRSYFFTDDNFARHPEWAVILDGMAVMRADGMDITCMMQLDTQAVRIPRFVEKAAAAGCGHVFIGLESINPANLEAAGKRHNRVEDFREMIETWRRHGVITQVGYILGFPGDTPASIADDVRRLRDEIGVDVAAFFILMPLPGSADHARANREGAVLDPDLNKYESTHALVDHPNMSRTELEQCYRDAWKQFYSIEHMKRALKGRTGTAYWSLFQMFLWYLNSSGQGEHPMLGGFWRKRSRTDRRPGFPADGRLRHGFRMLGSTAAQLRLWWRMLPVMQEVWLASRPIDPDEGRVATIAKGLLSLRPHLAMRGLIERINRMRSTRQDLTAYWRGLVRLGWHRANPLAAPWKALREWALLVQFLMQLRAAR